VSFKPAYSKNQVDGESGNNDVDQLMFEK